MATKTLKGKFLPQYRTAAQWSAADSVLLRGEIGVESDTRKFKFGDGTTSWNNLGYAQSGTTGGSGEAATYEPVEISEYGAIYDLTSLNEVPAGAIVTWYANGSVVDGDYGPFGGMAERVDGIYIAIKHGIRPYIRRTGGRRSRQCRRLGRLHPGRFLGKRKRQNCRSLRYNVGRGSV